MNIDLVSEWSRKSCTGMGPMDPTKIILTTRQSYTSLEKKNNNLMMFLNNESCRKESRRNKKRSHEDNISHKEPTQRNCFYES